MKFVRLPAMLVLGLLLATTSFALDRNAFTFTNYELNLRVEPEQQRLAVRGRITLRNDSQIAQKNAVLQVSSSLEWRSIQASGKQLQFVSQVYTSDIDHTGALSEAIVTLPEEVKPGGQVELQIGYEGVIPFDATRLTRIGTPEDIARRTDWDQIGTNFATVRGVGYVAWYPVAISAGNLSEGNTVFEVLGAWKARESGASMKLSFHSSRGEAENPSVLLCNGERKEATSQSSSDNLVQTDCSHSPLGLTVPVFVVGAYELVQSPALNVWTRPEHKQAADVYVAAANRDLSLITEWFGAPRPKAEVIELPQDHAAPFESGLVLLTPLNDDAKTADLSVVHELAHAVLRSPRLWIYEGAAHFAQALERERQSGRQAALDYMGVHRIALIQAEKTSRSDAAANAAAEQSLISTSDEELYRGKAMFVFWMLRDLLGGADLKKALVAYRAEDDKDPAYLQRLISAQSKRDLEWFFDDWVYRDRGLPDFRVESAYPRRTLLGGYIVTVTIEDVGTAGAEVPVTVKVEGGDVTRRLEVRAKSKASIRIEVPGTPLEVSVNDGSVPESDSSNNSLKVELTEKAD